MKNRRFLQALLKQPTDTTPIWIMRQAGRYLPEYRATRQKAGSFLGLMKTPEYACEVTLQPLDRYDLDAAILFSDILTVPDAMGLGLHFIEGEGPKLSNPIRTEEDVNRLYVPDVGTELDYVTDTVSLLRHSLNQRVPLIGFAGSPWTLASYMIEGGGSEDYATAKNMMYSRPDLMHRILDINARAVTDYLNAQIRAGAQAVMIFDSWGGYLSESAYLTFSLPYMKQIVDGLIKEQDGETVPSIIFTKGGGQWLHWIAQSGCHGVGLDWTTNIKYAKQLIGHRVALQGNMDPTILRSTPEAVAKEAIRIMQDFGEENTGHVFNLGHGISQFTDPENVRVLVDTVHDVGRMLRARQKEQLTFTINDATL
jgi:uroporphyrinogen decarboxylase